MGRLTARAASAAAAAGRQPPSPNHMQRRAMRILRPQPKPPPRPLAPAVPPAAGAGGMLRCRVRRADGRVFIGALPAARHRALQLGMLHAETAELVELTPGTRGPDGKLELDRRRRPEHYLAGGASGRRGWLEALLEHAEQIVGGRYSRQRWNGRPREEAFVGVAPRLRRRGDKHAIAHTRFLWVDVDQPGQLPALWALLAVRPCHLLIESGGSGGVHAYWKLDEPLAATRVETATGELIEPIEQAHLRLIHHLGVDDEGKPNVADAACKERARVMRLAGTVNWKTGHHARVVEVDFALPAYSLRELVGDLPDPAQTRPRVGARSPRRAAHEDPYKQIAPPEYFRRLAGITVPRGGLVSCPAPWHDDVHPSCSVGVDATQGWCCHAGSCGARGAIYDLASVLLGGPYGRELRGDAFSRARGARNRDLRRPHRTARENAGPGSRPRARAVTAEALYIVYVHDAINAELAGHRGCAYRSPPQPHADALALVGLLLGSRARAAPAAPAKWTRSVAGGRRTITLTPA